MNLEQYTKHLEPGHVQSFEQAIAQDPLNVSNYGIYADYLIDNDGDQAQIDILMKLYSGLPVLVQMMKDNCQRMWENEYRNADGVVSWFENYHESARDALIAANRFIAIRSGFVQPYVDQIVTTIADSFLTPEHLAFEQEFNRRVDLWDEEHNDNERPSDFPLMGEILGGYDITEGDTDWWPEGTERIINGNVFRTGAGDRTVIDTYSVKVIHNGEVRYRKPGQTMFSSTEYIKQPEGVDQVTLNGILHNPLGGGTFDFYWEAESDD